MNPLAEAIPAIVLLFVTAFTPSNGDDTTVSTTSNTTFLDTTSSVFRTFSPVLLSTSLPDIIFHTTLAAETFSQSTALPTSNQSTYSTASQDVPSTKLEVTSSLSSGNSTTMKTPSSTHSVAAAINETSPVTRVETTEASAMTTAALNETSIMTTAATTEANEITTAAFNETSTISTAAINETSPVTRVATTEASAMTAAAFNETSTMTTAATTEAIAMSTAAINETSTMTKVATTEDSIMSTIALNETSNMTTAATTEANAMTTAAFNETSIMTKVATTEDSIMTTAAFNETSIMTTVAINETSIISTVALIETSTMSTAAINETSPVTRVATTEASTMLTAAINETSTMSTLELNETSIMSTAAINETSPVTTVATTKASIMSTVAFNETNIMSTAATTKASAMTTSGFNETSVMTTAATTETSAKPTAATTATSPMSTVEFNETRTMSTVATAETSTMSTAAFNKTSSITTAAVTKTSNMSIAATTETSTMSTAATTEVSTMSTAAFNETSTMSTVATTGANPMPTPAFNVTKTLTTVAATEASTMSTAAINEINTMLTAALNETSNMTIAATHEPGALSTAAINGTGTMATAATTEASPMSTAEFNETSIMSTAATTEASAMTTSGFNETSTMTTFATAEASIMTIAATTDQGALSTSAISEASIMLTAALNETSTMTTAATTEANAMTTAATTKASIMSTVALNETSTMTTAAMTEASAMTTAETAETSTVSTAERINSTLLSTAFFPSNASNTTIVPLTTTANILSNSTSIAPSTLTTPTITTQSVVLTKCAAENYSSPNGILYFPETLVGFPASSSQNCSNGRAIASRVCGRLGIWEEPLILNCTVNVGMQLQSLQNVSIRVATEQLFVLTTLPNISDTELMLIEDALRRQVDSTNSTSPEDISLVAAIYENVRGKSSNQTNLRIVGIVADYAFKEDIPANGSSTMIRSSLTTYLVSLKASEVAREPSVDLDVSNLCQDTTATVSRISIPSSAFPTTEGEVVKVLVVFITPSGTYVPPNGVEGDLTGKIVSITVGGGSTPSTVTGLTDPITIAWNTEQKLSISRTVYNQPTALFAISAVCSFYDENTNIFSTEGVQIASGSETSTTQVCETTHLSSFAIFTQVSFPTYAPTVFFKVGCGFAIVGFGLVFLVYLLCRALRRDPMGILIINFSFTYMLALVLLLIAAEQWGTLSRSNCLVLASFQHLFLMLAVTSLAMAGFVAERNVANPLSYILLFQQCEQSTRNKAILRWTAGIYVVSVLIFVLVVGPGVGIYEPLTTQVDGTAVLHSDVYARQDSCLIQGPSLYFGFGIPAGLFYLIGLIQSIRGVIGVTVQHVTTEVRFLGAVAIFAQTRHWAESVLTVTVLTLSLTILCGVRVVPGQFSPSSYFLLDGFIGAFFIILGISVFIFFCIRATHVRRLISQGFNSLFSRHDRYMFNNDDELGHSVELNRFDHGEENPVQLTGAYKQKQENFY